MPASSAPQLVMLAEPASARAEAFRVLRARLQQSVGGRAPRSLLITSPTATEERHLVAANLALAFAESGAPVTLMDADLHHPQIHSVFALSETPGVLQCLREGTDCARALTVGPAANLRVMSAGGTHDVPAQLVGSAAFAALLEAAAPAGATLIVVAPPILPVADASLMAPLVDGVVLLGTAYRTNRAALREAKARLEGVRANILGVVLDGLSDGSGGKY